MSRKPEPLNIQPVNKRKSAHKRKGRFLQDPDKFPCPVCGEREFEWGHLRDAVYSTKKTMFVVGDTMRARLCLSCGNILPFLDNSD